MSDWKAETRDVIRVERPSTARRAWDALYIPEIARGLWITNKHFWQNIFSFVTKRSVTFQYPEVQRPLPPDARFYHRLPLREDGQPRCVACMCCATACPADCIHIEAAPRPGGPHEDPLDERYPERFTIDILRCVMCGLCVEACPVDAIRMDTGEIHDCSYDRERFVEKEELMSRGGLESHPPERFERLPEEHAA